MPADSARIADLEKRIDELLEHLDTYWIQYDAEASAALEVGADESGEALDMYLWMKVS